MIRAMATATEEATVAKLEAAIATLTTTAATPTTVVTAAMVAIQQEDQAEMKKTLVTTTRGTTIGKNQRREFQLVIPRQTLPARKTRHPVTVVLVLPHTRP